MSSNSSIPTHRDYYHSTQPWHPSYDPSYHLGRSVSAVNPAPSFSGPRSVSASGSGEGLSGGGVPGSYRPTWTSAGMSGPLGGSSRDFSSRSLVHLGPSDLLRASGSFASVPSVRSSAGAALPTSVGFSSLHPSPGGFPRSLRGGDSSGEASCLLTRSLALPSSTVPRDFSALQVPRLSCGGVSLGLPSARELAAPPFLKREISFPALTKDCSFQPSSRFASVPPSARDVALPRMSLLEQKEALAPPRLDTVSPRFLRPAGSSLMGRVDVSPSFASGIDFSSLMSRSLGPRPIAPQVPSLTPTLPGSRRADPCVDLSKFSFWTSSPEYGRALRALEKQRDDVIRSSPLVSFSPRAIFTQSELFLKRAQEAAAFCEGTGHAFAVFKPNAQTTFIMDPKIFGSSSTAARTDEMGRELSLLASRRMSIAKGVIHGGVDFAAGNVQGAQSVLAYIGADLLDLTPEERFGALDSFEQTQARQKAALDGAVIRILRVDPSDPVYQLSRSITATGLEVASLAAGGVGAVRGGIHFVKLCKPPSARALMRLHEGGVGLVGDSLAIRKGFVYEKGAAGHYHQIIHRGEHAFRLERPYMRSPLTIGEIIQKGTPMQDPRGKLGFIRYDVPGTFRGSEGTWELVLDPETGIIQHFNFNGK